jgi:hypothetical protein
MDSVKLWDLERPWLQDIIMKPQSLIYDMRGNSEYFYSKNNKLIIYLVAEYSAASSSVILSLISMSDLNLKSGSVQ